MLFVGRMVVSIWEVEMEMEMTMTKKDDRLLLSDQQRERLKTVQQMLADGVSPYTRQSQVVHRGSLPAATERKVERPAPPMGPRDPIALSDMGDPIVVAAIKRAERNQDRRDAHAVKKAMRSVTAKQVRKGGLFGCVARRAEAMVLEVRDIAEEATKTFEHELATRAFVASDAYYLAEEAEQVAREEQSMTAEYAADVLLASEPYEERKS